MFVKSRLIGAALLIGAIWFGYAANDVALVNQSQTMVVDTYRGLSPGQEYIEVMDDVVAELDRNPRYRVDIIGHTGTRGSDVDNQTLSTQRAQRAALDLIRAGIDDARIRVIGVGESQPLVQDPSETDTQWQRRLSRVVFHIHTD